MRRLAEWIEVDEAPAAPHPELACTNSLAEWAGIPYAELSVVLAHLRYLTALHQTHHWVARGDTFYGDHQLFQRLYEGTLQDVDDVAERAVGLGCEQNVCLALQLRQVVAVDRSTAMPQTMPQSSGLAQASLHAERAFLVALHEASSSLCRSDAMTAGIENLLQQVADRHERHVYLLRQRCSKPPMGF